MPISHFVTIAEGDAFQYRNQFPEFYSDPLGQMRGVLVEISKRPASFERSYQQFVNELVFGDSVSFAEARSAFLKRRISSSREWRPPESVKLDLIEGAHFTRP